MGLTVGFLRAMGFLSAHAGPDGLHCFYSLPGMFTILIAVLPTDTNLVRRTGIALCFFMSSAVMLILLVLLMAGVCLCLCRAFPLADTAFGHAGEDCGDTCRALTGRDAPRLARKRRRWQQRRRE